jgi:hypothetical protein
MKKIVLLIVSLFCLSFSLNSFAFEAPNDDFKLVQTDEKTTLTYKGEGVYEWTHFLKSYNSYG